MSILSRLIFLFILNLGFANAAVCQHASIEDLLRRVREAGLEGRAGETTENASLLGSFEFVDLEREVPGIYGSTKHTFRLAGEYWARSRNSRLATDEPREELSYTLRTVIRNQYLHQVAAFLPDLRRRVYSDSDRQVVRSLLLGASPLPTDTWQTPNNHLCRHVIDYLNELLVQSVAEPRSILSRVLGDLDRRTGGAPLGGGLAPRWGVLEVTVSHEGRMATNVATNIRFDRHGIDGRQQTEGFTSNPGIYRVPAGKWIVTVTSPSSVEERRVNIREGIVEKLLIALAGSNVHGAEARSPEVWSDAESADGIPQQDRALLSAVSRLGVPVVAYDPRALADAWSHMPGNYAELLAPYAGMLEISGPRGQRGKANDMTGKPANPSLNDVRIVIRVTRESLLSTSLTQLDYKSYEADVMWCLVQWINAINNLAVNAEKPMAVIDIDNSLFVRAEGRYWLEDYPASVGRIRWQHYAAIEKNEFGVAQSLPDSPKRWFPATPDLSVDLTIRILNDVAKSWLGRFTPSSVGHEGLIEIFEAAADGKILPQAEFDRCGDTTKYSFRRVLLHELGHYFGVGHVPSERADQDRSIFAKCIMNASYRQLGDTLTPVDSMMGTHVSFLSLDVRGRRCEGLLR